MAREELLLELKLNTAKSLQGIKKMNEETAILKKFLKEAPREGEEGFKKLEPQINKAKLAVAENAKVLKEFNRSLKDLKPPKDSLNGLASTLRVLRK